MSRGWRDHVVFEPGEFRAPGSVGSNSTARTAVSRAAGRSLYSESRALVQPPNIDLVGEIRARHH